MTPAELIEAAQRGWPVRLSGAQRQDVARIAVDALAGAGLVVVPACGCGQPVGVCHSCEEARCWHCDPGLGKHHTPMKCNRKHEPSPAALSERNDRA